MDFFKRKKERVDGSALRLGDFEKIQTRFCFLDESGNLNDRANPLFTVGFIKCTQPYYLNSKLMYERGKRNFYDELKFNKLSKNNLEFAKLALDSFFSTRSLSFSSFTLDKEGSYFNTVFGGDPWKAYEDISVKVLKSAIHADEIIIVVADHVTTPKEIRFEVNVKRRINQGFGRLAVAGVSRFDSRSNDILQLTDLMIGAINYDLKLATRMVISGDRHKRQFVEYFRKNLGVQNLVNSFRNFNFNIFVDKEIQGRLPFPAPENEKEPSS